MTQKSWSQASLDALRVITCREKVMDHKMVARVKGTADQLFQG